jgi:hypothetical protein
MLVGVSGHPEKDYLNVSGSKTQYVRGWAGLACETKNRARGLDIGGTCRKPPGTDGRACRMPLRAFLAAC